MRRDAHFCERAEACIDAVNGLAFLDHVIDKAFGKVDAAIGGGVKRNWHMMLGDRAQHRQCHFARLDHKVTHQNSPS